MNIFTKGDRVQMRFIPSFVGTAVNPRIDITELSENEDVWMSVQWDGHHDHTYYPTRSIRQCK